MSVGPRSATLLKDAPHQRDKGLAKTQLKVCTRRMPITGTSERESKGILGSPSRGLWGLISWLSISPPHLSSVGFSLWLPTQLRSGPDPSDAATCSLPRHPPILGLCPSLLAYPTLWCFLHIEGKWKALEYHRLLRNLTKKICLCSVWSTC